MTKRLILALLLVAFWAAPTFAGRLAADLQETITTAQPDELVPVWIKLYPVESGDELKRSVANPSATAVEQHAAMLDRLKSNQQAAQAQLIAALTELAVDGSASDIREFWIANAVVAKVSAAELELLAQRDDVEIIYAAPRVESIRPPIDRPQPVQIGQADSVANHITYTGADQAWGLGYDGTGRLICTFDSGIDGDHPALVGNWRGNYTDWRAAWFDPVGQDTFPNTIVGSGLFSHGTWVAGVAFGYDSSIAYATGVAPGAQWISAAVTDLPTENSHAILEAFEWAADPDGNPNTISDRPDVINHSWGFVRNLHDISCEDIFFDAIDNIEALGIVNIFAAGNSGSGAQTIANPANRALDSIDCFAVGAIGFADTANPTVASFSSRGPSDCDGVSTKPNVVAPGVGIRTSNPGGTYVLQQGTSFSAPQVAGLVALMRQKNPNATVEEIKTAILNSTNRDHFPAGPNDSTGWGEIDCLAAVNALSAINTQPNVRVYDFTYAPVMPGDTLQGIVTVQNIGAAATGVTGVASSSNPDVTVISGAVDFASVAEGQVKVGVGAVEIAISENVRIGSVTQIPFDLTVSGQPVAASLAILIGPARERGLATHSTGRIDFTVSNFGMMGMGPVSIVPSQGVGFDFDGGGNHLWEGGIIMATSPTQVSSGLHSYIYASDYDFTVADGGFMEYWEPTGGPIAQRARCAFIDRNSDNPINVRVDQESFSFNAPDDDYVIMRFILTNENSTTVTGLRFGVFMDWDIVSFLQNAGAYEIASGLLWMGRNTGTVSNYRGLAMLHGTPSTALTRLGDSALVPFFGGDGFEKDEKYRALAAGFGTTDTYRTAGNDFFSVLAAGPLTLAPGELDTLAYAILAGSTLVDISQAVGRAQIKYDEVTIATDVDDPDAPNLPQTYTLRQNYPNPFNPSTTISFDLPKAGNYTLQIINVLGQVVEEIEDYTTAGTVTYEWQAGDAASGVYFYKLITDEYVASRKMMLLK